MGSGDHTAPILLITRSRTKQGKHSRSKHHSGHRGPHDKVPGTAKTKQSSKMLSQYAGEQRGNCSHNTIKQVEEQRDQQMVRLERLNNLAIDPGAMMRKVIIVNAASKTAST